MSSNLLTKVLTTPSKIASALDWKKAVGGCVLSIDIHKDTIGLAVSGHPSYNQSMTELEPIQLHKRGKVQPECRNRLAQLVKDHNVCGFVVSFPLQQDTGRMGAACGRTLHTLDSLLADGNIATQKRPLCLWDSQHPIAQPEDKWGRSSAYVGGTSEKTIHIASQEQYNQDENIVAAQVWEDFCRANWPDLEYEVEVELKEEERPQHVAAVVAAEVVEQQQQWDDNSSGEEFVNLAVVC